MTTFQLSPSNYLNVLEAHARFWTSQTRGYRRFLLCPFSGGMFLA